MYSTWRRRAVVTLGRAAGGLAGLVAFHLPAVAAVALGILGPATLLSPTAAHAATEQAVTTQTHPHGAALGVIVTVLVAGCAFVVGLLIGEGVHRRRMARRERQLVEERRRVDELTEALRGRDRRRDARTGGP